MDIDACVEWLKALGCEIETEDPSDGSRLWLVFDEGEPDYYANFGWPNFFTDAELVRLVEQLQIIEAYAPTI